MIDQINPCLPAGRPSSWFKKTPLKVTAWLVLCVFLFNTLAVDSCLAEVVSARQNNLSVWSFAERDTLRDLLVKTYIDSRLIRIADTDFDREQLARYQADALLQPSGRYLIDETTRKDTLKFIKAVTNEDFWVLWWQQERNKANRIRYLKLRNEILDNGAILSAYNNVLSRSGRQAASGADLSEELLANIMAVRSVAKDGARSILFNDIMARAFELDFLLNKEKVIAKSEVRAEDLAFLDVMRPALDRLEPSNASANDIKLPVQFFDKVARMRHILRLQEKKGKGNEDVPAGEARDEANSPPPEPTSQVSEPANPETRKDPETQVTGPVQQDEFMSASPIPPGREYQPYGPGDYVYEHPYRWFLISISGAAANLVTCLASAALLFILCNYPDMNIFGTAVIAPWFSYVCSYVFVFNPFAFTLIFSHPPDWPVTVKGKITDKVSAIKVLSILLVEMPTDIPHELGHWLMFKIFGIKTRFHRDDIEFAGIRWFSEDDRANLRWAVRIMRERGLFPFNKRTKPRVDPTSLFRRNFNLGILIGAEAGILAAAAKIARGEAPIDVSMDERLNNKALLKVNDRTDGRAPELKDAVVEALKGLLRGSTNDRLRFEKIETGGLTIEPATNKKNVFCVAISENKTIDKVSPPFARSMFVDLNSPTPAEDIAKIQNNIYGKDFAKAKKEDQETMGTATFIYKAVLYGGIAAATIFGLIYSVRKILLSGGGGKDKNDGKNRLRRKGRSLYPGEEPGAGRWRRGGGGPSRRFEPPAIGLDEGQRHDWRRVVEGPDATDRRNPFRDAKGGWVAHMMSPLPPGAGHGAEPQTRITKSVIVSLRERAKEAILRLYGGKPEEKFSESPEVWDEIEKYITALNKYYRQIEIRIEEAIKEGPAIGAMGVKIRLKSLKHDLEDIEENAMKIFVYTVYISEHAERLQPLSSLIRESRNRRYKMLSTINSWIKSHPGLSRGDWRLIRMLRAKKPARKPEAAARHSVIDMGAYKQILISASPAEGTTLEEQGADLLLNIDKVLSENGCDRDSVVKQVIFLKDISGRKKCEEIMGKHYGRAPPATSYIRQPPINGEFITIEILAIPKRDGVEIKRINSNLTIFEQGGTRWAYVAGAEPDDGIKDTYEQALNTLRKMQGLLEANGFKFDQVVRTWIYENKILRKNKGRQRYQLFNDARKAFFETGNAGKPIRFANARPPASTGIGMSGGSFVMECLAIDSKGNDLQIIPIENPQQTSAYEYTKEVLKKGVSSEKKAPPLFSRGMAISLGGFQTILISGTASVKGEKVVHAGDVEKQTETTIENIGLVLGQAGAVIGNIPQLRVYIKKRKDYEKVRRIVEARFPDVPCLYLIGDVCRPEWLVEIEAIAYKAEPFFGPETKMVNDQDRQICDYPYSEVNAMLAELKAKGCITDDDDIIAARELGGFKNFFIETIRNSLEAVVRRDLGAKKAPADVRIRALIRNGELWLQVIDNGVGFTDDELARVGREMYSSTGRLSRGSYLYSAAIGAKIADWRLFFENRKDGPGACVSLVIPRVTPQPRREEREGPGKDAVNGPDSGGGDGIDREGFTPVAQVVAGWQLAPDATQNEVDELLLRVARGPNQRLKNILGFRGDQRRALDEGYFRTIEELLAIKGIGDMTIKNARDRIRLAARCHAKYKNAFPEFVRLVLSVRAGDTEEIVKKKTDDIFSAYRDLLNDKEFLDSFVKYFGSDYDIMLYFTYILWARIRAGPEEGTEPAVEILITLLNVKSQPVNYIPLYRIKAMEYAGLSAELLKQLDLKNKSNLKNRAVINIAIPLARHSQKFKNYIEKDEYYRAGARALVSLAVTGNPAAFYGLLKTVTETSVVKLVSDILVQARPGYFNQGDYIVSALKHRDRKVRSHGYYLKNVREALFKCLSLASEADRNWRSRQPLFSDNSRVQLVPVTIISAGGYNAPKEDDVRSIMNRIKGQELGMSVPIRVRVNADGGINIDGITRMEALRRLGVDYAAAHVVYHDTSLIGRLPFIDIKPVPPAKAAQLSETPPADKKPRREEREGPGKDAVNGPDSGGGDGVERWGTVPPEEPGAGARSMRIEVRPDESYEVLMARDLFGPQNKLLARKIGGRKTFFVVDKGIGGKQIKALKEYIAAHKLGDNILIVGGGERVKNGFLGLFHVLKTAHRAWRAGIDRKSVFVLIGGGATLDMAGFAASIFHRGTAQIRIPTTLLAQDDAGIGVKNGINFFGKKNFLGVFQPPETVLIDPYFLATADKRIISDGLAEIIKVTLMKDREGFEYLENNYQAMLNLPELLNAGRNAKKTIEAAEELIWISVKNHLGQISTDPYETKSARPLDYGHEWAHRLEAVTRHRLSHGQAVAIGMKIDSYFSWKRQYITKEEFDRIIRLIRSCGLPTYDKAATFKKLWPGLEEFRQHLGGELTVSLLKGIGQKQDVREIKEDELKEALLFLKVTNPKPAAGTILSGLKKLSDRLFENSRNDNIFRPLTAAKMAVGVLATFCGMWIDCGFSGCTLIFAASWIFLVIARNAAVDLKANREVNKVWDMGAVRKRKLANDIFASGISSIPIIAGKLFLSGGAVSFFSGGIVLNIILDIIIVSLIAGPPNYFQRKLREFPRSVAWKDFFRSFVMSAGAYAGFGLIYIFGGSEAIIPSAALFAIARKFIGEWWGGWCEYPYLKDLFSRIKAGEANRRYPSDRYPSASPDPGTRDGMDGPPGASGFPRYRSFEEALAVFKNGNIKWTMTTIPMRREFVNILARSLGKEPGALNAFNFTKGITEFNGRSLKVLLGKYRDNGRLTSREGAKKLKSALGIDDLLNKKKWEEKKKDWGRVCQIINETMGATVNTIDVISYLEKNRISVKADIALGREVRLGDSAAKEALIYAYKKDVLILAKYIARTNNKGITEDELLGAGLIALSRSIERYDPERGIGLWGFVGSRTNPQGRHVMGGIEGAMRDHIRNALGLRRKISHRERPYDPADDGPHGEHAGYMENVTAGTDTGDAEEAEAKKAKMIESALRILRGRVRIEHLDIFIAYLNGETQAGIARRLGKGVSYIFWVVDKCRRILEERPAPRLLPVRGAPRARYRDFDKALSGISKFKARDFDFGTLCRKARALLAYRGPFEDGVRNFVNASVLDMALFAGPETRNDGRVLGLAGEISGLYEVLIKRTGTLKDIDFGRLKSLDTIVYRGDTGFKEFDAISDNTVFEFKFHLTLLKLYQQVIGMDPKRTPHLKVLTRDGRFREIRNIVYFGEADGGQVVKALTEFLEKRPELKSKVIVTPKEGVSVKFDLSQMKDFLYSRETIAFARREVRNRRSKFLLHGFPHSREEMERLIDAKKRQLNGRSFDVIIAISSALPQDVENLRKLLPAAERPREGPIGGEAPNGPNGMGDGAERSYPAKITISEGGRIRSAMRNFGKQLRALMKARGCTDDSLAKKVDFPTFMIKRLTLGKVNLNRTMIARIDEALTAEGKILEAFDLIGIGVSLPAPRKDAPLAPPKKKKTLDPMPEEVLAQLRIIFEKDCPETLAIFDRLCAEPDAGELAGIWKDLRKKHPESIPSALGVHMRLKKGNCIVLSTHPNKSQAQALLDWYNSKRLGKKIRFPEIGNERLVARCIALFEYERARRGKLTEMGLKLLKEEIIEWEFGTKKNGEAKSLAGKRLDDLIEGALKSAAKKAPSPGPGRRRELRIPETVAKYDLTGVYFGFVPRAERRKMRRDWPRGLGLMGRGASAVPTDGGQDRKVPTFDAMAAYLKDKGEKFTVAVPVADYESTLGAINKLIEELGDKAGAILVGDEGRIKKIIEENNLSFILSSKDITIINTPDKDEALKTAMRYAREGRAQIVLKGRTGSHELMAAALSKENGLRAKGKIISHMRIFETEWGIMIMTDGGINVISDIKDPEARKAALAIIIDNAVKAARLLGIREPKVLCLGTGEGEYGLKAAMAEKPDVVIFSSISPANIIYKAGVDTPWRLEHIGNDILSGHLGRMSIFKKDDGGILIIATPKAGAGFEIKRELLDKAVRLAAENGVAAPKVALVDFTERPEKFMGVPSIADGVRLASIYRGSDECVVEGPMAYDIAVSAEAAEAKKFKGKVPGQPDILFMPDYDSGVLLAELYDNWDGAGYLGVSRNAGDISFGGLAPVLVPSRSDSPPHKCNSIIAAAYLLAQASASTRLSAEPGAAGDGEATPSLSTDIDTRAVENGLLDPAYVGHDMATREMINPNHEDKVAIYGYAGADWSNFILSTDTTKAYFVDATPVDFDLLCKLLDKEWENLFDFERFDVIQHLTGYREKKFKKGFGGGGIKNMMPMIERKILLELKGMGVKKSKSDGTRNIEIIKKDGTITISFEWTYAGQKAKTYSITFINTNIEKPDEYPDNLRDVLNAGIDIYYQRASLQGPKNYRSFLPFIASKVKEGGYLVTDDASYKDLASIEVNPDVLLSENSQFSYTPQGAISSEKLTYWTKIIEEKKGDPKGVFYHYGWHVNIRQKKPKAAPAAGARNGTVIGQDAPKGSLARAIVTINANKKLRNGTFTKKEFQEARARKGDPHSDTTVYSELNGLVKVGILEVDTSAKAYRYKLTSNYANAPPETKRAITRYLKKKLPARPTDDQLKEAKRQIEYIMSTNAAVLASAAMPTQAMKEDAKECLASLYGRFRFFPAQPKEIRDYIKQSRGKSISESRALAGLAGLERLGLVEKEKDRYRLIDWARRLDKRQFGRLTSIVSSANVSRRRILKYLLKARIEAFENYGAPLSDKGKTIITHARAVLDNRSSAEEAIKAELAALFNPRKVWFVKCYEQLSAGDKKLLSKIEVVNFTWGCSTQCDYCFARAPGRISVMPWPWVGELRRAMNRTNVNALIFSDPLRDYYDPIFDKTFADIAGVFDTERIDTSGFEPGSVGERAALEIGERYPKQIVTVMLCINVVNGWIRRIGKDKYIEYMKHAIDVFRGKGIKVNFNLYDTMKKGEGINVVEVIEKITGAPLENLPAGATCKGRMLSIGPDRYVSLTYTKGQDFGDAYHIMPNGDIALGPLDDAATEYRCLRKHPLTEAIVTYVDKPTPEPDWADKDTLGLYFCDLYEIYDSEPNIPYYLKMFVDAPKLRDSGPYMSGRYCDKDLWKHLKGLMESAHRPDTWFFGNKTFWRSKSEHIIYAEYLSRLPFSGANGSNLQREFIKLCRKVSTDDPESYLRRVGLNDFVQPNIFALVMFFIVTDTSALLEKIEKDPQNEVLKDKLQEFGKLLDLIHELIYRQWDAGPCIKSHYLFKDHASPEPAASPAAGEAGDVAGSGPKAAAEKPRFSDSPDSSGGMDGGREPEASKSEVVSPAMRLAARVPNRYGDHTVALMAGLGRQHTECLLSMFERPENAGLKGIYISPEVSLENLRQWLGPLKHSLASGIDTRITSGETLDIIPRAKPDIPDDPALKLLEEVDWYSMSEASPEQLKVVLEKWQKRLPVNVGFDFNPNVIKALYRRHRWNYTGQLLEDAGIKMPHPNTEPPIPIEDFLRWSEEISAKIIPMLDEAYSIVQCHELRAHFTKIILVDDPSQRAAYTYPILKCEDAKIDFGLKDSDFGERGICYALVINKSHKWVEDENKYLSCIIRHELGHLFTLQGHEYKDGHNITIREKIFSERLRENIYIEPVSFDLPESMHSSLPEKDRDRISFIFNELLADWFSYNFCNRPDERESMYKFYLDVYSRGGVHRCSTEAIARVFTIVEACGISVTETESPDLKRFMDMASTEINGRGQGKYFKILTRAYIDLWKSLKLRIAPPAPSVVPAAESTRLPGLLPKITRDDIRQERITFFMIKPDGIPYIDEITKRIRGEGYEILYETQPLNLNEEAAKDLYAGHIEKPFYSGLTRYVTGKLGGLPSDKVVLLVLRGEPGAWKRLHDDVVGKNDGSTPGSLRHGIVKIIEGVQCNRAHSSGSFKEALNEISIMANRHRGELIAGIPPATGDANSQPGYPTQVKPLEPPANSPNIITVEENDCKPAADAVTALYCRIILCRAVAAFNARTGQRRLAHLDADAVDNEGMPKKLFKDISGPDWKIAVITKKEAKTDSGSKPDFSYDGIRNFLIQEKGVEPDKIIWLEGPTTTISGLNLLMEIMLDAQGVVRRNILPEDLKRLTETERDSLRVYDAVSPSALGLGSRDAGDAFPAHAVRARLSPQEPAPEAIDIGEYAQMISILAANYESVETILAVEGGPAAHGGEAVLELVKRSFPLSPERAIIEEAIERCRETQSIPMALDVSQREKIMDALLCIEPEPENILDDTDKQHSIVRSKKPLEFDEGLLYHGRESLDEAILNGSISGDMPLARVPHCDATGAFKKTSKSPAIFMISTALFNKLRAERRAKLKIGTADMPDVYPTITTPVSLDDVMEIWIDGETYGRYERIIEDPSSDTERSLKPKIEVLLGSGKIKVIPGLRHTTIEKPRDIAQYIWRYLIERDLIQYVPKLRLKNTSEGRGNPAASAPLQVQTDPNLSKLVKGPAVEPAAGDDSTTPSDDSIQIIVERIRVIHHTLGNILFRIRGSLQGIFEGRIKLEAAESGLLKDIDRILGKLIDASESLQGDITHTDIRKNVNSYLEVSRDLIKALTPETTGLLVSVHEKHVKASPSTSSEEAARFIKSFEWDIKFTKLMLVNEFGVKRQEKSAVDIREILDVAALIENVGDKRVRYIKNYETGQLYVSGVEADIYTILVNIFRNARESLMPKGGEVRSQTSIKDGYVEIKIADSGQGMPSDMADAFNTGRPAGSTKGEGHGSGLGTIRELVKKNGGTIEAVSKPGTGTTFIIRLPLVPPGDNLSGMFGMAGDGKNANKYDKNQPTDKKNIQSGHDQSPSLISNVATMNVAMKKSNPPTNTPIRKDEAEINCPITSAANTSLPTSNNALDSSARCVLPNLKPGMQPNITHGYDLVKPPQAPASEVVKPTEEGARKMFEEIDAMVGRDTSYNTAIGDCGKILQNLPDVSQLRLAIPIEVLKNSVDITLVLRKKLALLKVPFRLEVTGVREEDEILVDNLIEKLVLAENKNADDLKNVTVTSIKENDIIGKANEISRSVRIEMSQLQLRTEAIKQLSLGGAALVGKEYMAIITDVVPDAQAQKLEEVLKDQLADNISIRIMTSPDPSKSLFMLSGIISSWLSDIKAGSNSTILRLPAIVAPREMMTRLGEAVRLAWTTLIAA